MKVYLLYRNFKYLSYNEKEYFPTIISIFSTKENAEEFRKKLWDKDYWQPSYEEGADYFYPIREFSLDREFAEPYKDFEELGNMYFKSCVGLNNIKENKNG